MLRYFRMAVDFAPYILLQILDDLGASGCDKEDASFDDNLYVISVPILYPRTGDGSDTAGNYTSSLIPNTNLTYYLMLVSGTSQASDYGHADLLFEYNAEIQIINEFRQHLLVHADITKYKDLNRGSQLS